MNKSLISNDNLVTPQPIMVLVRPQMGENIGAAMRVMANFGLGELRLVAPRDGWPNEAALAMAAGAEAHLKVNLYNDTAAAIADCQTVFATTARSRAVNKPVVDAAGAVAAMRGKSAILFGPERTGLENEEVALADAIVTLPVNPAFASLNLAQAVAILSHALAALPLPFSTPEQIPASREAVQHLFDHLESELDARQFWKVPEKKEVMWLNIRSLLLRAEPSAQEVNTLRGMIRALTEFPPK